MLGDAEKARHCPTLPDTHQYWLLGERIEGLLEDLGKFWVFVLCLGFGVDAVKKVVQNVFLVFLFVLRFSMLFLLVTNIII